MVQLQVAAGNELRSTSGNVTLSSAHELDNVEANAMHESTQTSLAVVSLLEGWSTGCTNKLILTTLNYTCLVRHVFSAPQKTSLLWRAGVRMTLSLRCIQNIDRR